jgi:hypothetical protein
VDYYHVGREGLRRECRYGAEDGEVEVDQRRTKKADEWIAMDVDGCTCLLTYRTLTTYYAEPRLRGFYRVIIYFNKPIKNAVYSKSLSLPCIEGLASRTSFMA